MSGAGPFSLADYSALLRCDGSTVVAPIRQEGLASDEGLNVGFAALDRAPPHGGERHPDGDEMLILLSGDVSIILEEPAAQTVRLRSREGFIVPKGVWHRLLVHSRSEIIYLTPGRSEVKPSQGGYASAS